jgi:hypothetical protein
MLIRTYGPGDDVAQVGIYNEAAADLPKFKPAMLDELRRRSRATAFDPAARFLALENGRPVGYVTFQASGRVSYPWCRKGHESAAEPLFEHVLKAMKDRGLARAFSAYRADWPVQLDFFRRHGFEQRREMVSFALDLPDMPTPMARPSSAVGPLTPDDLPAVLAMAPAVLRVRDVAELEQHLFHNPYFPPESAFALRRRSGGEPIAVGLIISGPDYAHPRQVDPAMPCFWLGAFGNEGLQTKRINGLFGFLTAEGRDVHPIGLDLLGYAAVKLEDTDVETFGAQVPSDATHLLQFYSRYFRRLGSFPVLEREL